MQVILPDQKTPMLLETSVLVALVKIIKPKIFFEFGTYLGIQTLNIAANLPSSVKIYTLDFDADFFKEAVQDKHDVAISEKHFEYENKLAFMGSIYEQRIERLYGDLNSFDFSDLYDSVDMIYIDGGHDLRTLMSDTKNALKMLSSHNISCIVWHDYNNANYPQVTEYLNDLSSQYDIYHVEETMMCFYIKNPERTISF